MEEMSSRQPPRAPVEELGPQTYCQRAALELAVLIRHQQKPKAGIRRDSALLRRCVEQVLGSSTVTALVEGPWRTGARPLKRPGRGGLRFIPLVTRGKTTVMVVHAHGGGRVGRLPQLLRHPGPQRLGR